MTDEADGSAVTAMFPLGSVLFPGMFMPLHIFESRYRELISDCLEGDRTFGTALIERGSEVGGGDQRLDVAVRARIIEAEQFDDGRWAILAVGLDRALVTEWLADDPYPRAMLTDLPDPIDGNDITGLIGEASDRLGAFMIRAAVLGFQVPQIELELSPDPSLASYQLAACSPMGPSDRYELLRSAGPAERLERFIEMIDDQLLLLEGRMMPPPAGGFGPDAN